LTPLVSPLPLSARVDARGAIFDATALGVGARLAAFYMFT
jgi:hypothetical protein